VYANIPDIDHNKVIVSYKEMYQEIKEVLKTALADNKFILKIIF
jgi:hypothetical protein